MAKKQKLTKEQKAETKRRNDFSTKIEKIFVGSGFSSVKVNHFQFKLGNRSNELDHLFVYENILIIAEDTIRALKEKEKCLASGQQYGINHKAQKEETSRIISEKTVEFLEILKDEFPEESTFSFYKANELKIFYLYFEYGATGISSDDAARYSHLVFIDAATMNYFFAMSQSIKRSFRYELFRYLRIQRSDVGKADPNEESDLILKTSIIYPDSTTGFSGGVRMVSFMMRPSTLLENCCVLRKDGWKEKLDLYQRLITPKRIKSVRDFVCENNTTFLNNIIVTLPKGVSFFKTEADGTQSLINIDDIVKYDKNITMHIPSDYNSMAIIDGQHRVYAYYEDPNSQSEQEQKISRLRNELNLLVTGIIYPNNEKFSNDLEKRKFESSLFVSINKNAKPVDADTLIQVQSIMNPTSGEAISRKVIEKLNETGPFKQQFQLSKVVPAPIKTASIIEYALASLLVARNTATSLYSYWLLKEGKSNDFTLVKEQDIDSYINYCVRCLNEYFSAIHSKFLSYWNNDSKLLKVISINAFIIAFRETLMQVGGPKNSAYYQSVLSRLKMSFNDEDGAPFPYAGARYSRFAKDKLIPLFLRSPN